MRDSASNITVITPQKVQAAESRATAEAAAKEEALRAASEQVPRLRSNPKKHGSSERLFSRSSRW